MSFRRWLHLALAAGIVAMGTSLSDVAMAQEPIPVFAYYYIWYNASSWNRAKIDYQQIGRYSSDEADVMRQHVRWAKAAGITGFVVSWKSTPALDRRLATLVRIADQEHFQLALIYEGLDFFRAPLPVSRVLHDLRFFAGRYGSDAAFSTFGKPVVVWSGTWEFSPTQVASVTRVVGDRLQILASERTADDYERLAPYVAGDAYYWSSVNPNTYPGYPAKLADMGRAVHAHGGLWVAPAAPGFDARLVGGTTVVPRKGGETLRVELDTAIASEPDAVGLISWNEFSENSQIEPSVKFGDRYLQVLADALHAPGPSIPDFDSSAPSGAGAGVASAVALGGLVALMLASTVVVARRARRAEVRSG